MKRKYMILSVREGSMATRQLDSDQYSLLDGIANELNLGTECLKITEIPIGATLEVFP